MHTQTKKNGWFWKQIPLFAIALNRSERINCRKWKSVEESSVFKTVASEWWAQKIAKDLQEKTAQCRLDGDGIKKHTK